MLAPPCLLCWGQPRRPHSPRPDLWVSACTFVHERVRTSRFRPGHHVHSDPAPEHVKGGVKLDQRSDGKIDHFLVKHAFLREGFAGRLERRPATRLRVALRPERKPSSQIAARRRTGWLGTSLGWPSLFTVLEPVTFSVHLQDVDVMGEPIQQRSRQPFRSECLGPLIER
jgi:hypothetical protein